MPVTSTVNSSGNPSPWSLISARIPDSDEYSAADEEALFHSIWSAFEIVETGVHAGPPLRSPDKTYCRPPLDAIAMSPSGAISAKSMESRIGPPSVAPPRTPRMGRILDDAESLAGCHRLALAVRFRFQNSTSIREYAARTQRRKLEYDFGVRHRQFPGIPHFHHRLGDGLGLVSFTALSPARSRFSAAPGRLAPPTMLGRSKNKPVRQPECQRPDYLGSTTFSPQVGTLYSASSAKRVGVRERLKITGLSFIGNTLPDV